MRRLVAPADCSGDGGSCIMQVKSVRASDEDEPIIVEEPAHSSLLGGPPLWWKASTGEVVSAEDLGGGDVHTRLSGVVDYLAQNDLHALSLARDIVGNLNRPPKQIPNQIEPRAPKYDAVSSHGVIPTDTRKPFDIREIIARIVDASEFDEFKAPLCDYL